MDVGDLYLPAKPTNLPEVITGSVLAWPVLFPNDTPVGVILPPAPHAPHPGGILESSPTLHPTPSPWQVLTTLPLKHPELAPPSSPFLSGTCSSPFPGRPAFSLGPFLFTEQRGTLNLFVGSSPRLLSVSSGSYPEALMTQLLLQHRLPAPTLFILISPPQNFCCHLYMPTVVPFVVAVPSAWIPFPQVLTGLHLSPSRSLP